MSKIIIKHIIDFRDFFYIKLNRRYPLYKEDMLHKESINALLMLLSGYYATIVTLLLIVLQKFKLVTPPSPGLNLKARLVVGILFIGPIFLIRRFMIKRLSKIEAKEHIGNEDEMLRRIIAAGLLGYILIFAVPTVLDYLLRLWLPNK